MNEVIHIIDQITKYGLNSTVPVEKKERDLEKYLVQFYAKYFEIAFTFDESDYPDWKEVESEMIRKNVVSNFPDFGYYHDVDECHKLKESAQLSIGDVVDDLMDIIMDLLEIKWRYENNSKDDALWYFELMFTSHTQQHILSLLNFIKSKNKS